MAAQGNLNPGQFPEAKQPQKQGWRAAFRQSRAAQKQAKLQRQAEPGPYQGANSAYRGGSRGFKSTAAVEAYAAQQWRRSDS
jgi:hypothetical protein